jgi:AraC-like DNA-binding protein
MGSLKQLILVLICISCLFGFYLLKKKQNSTKKLNYKLLRFLLGSLFYIFSFELLISISGRDTSNFIVVLLSYIFYPVLLTISPFLYLYVKSFSISNMDRLSFQENIKHFLIAIVLFIINIFTFLAVQNLETGSQKLELFNNISTYLNFTIFFYVFLIQNLIYIYLAVILYINHRAVFQIEKEDTLKTLRWIKLFLISYTVIFIILYLFQLQGLQSIKLLFRISVLIYIMALIYYGLKDYEELNENANEDDLEAVQSLSANIDFSKVEQLVDAAINLKFYLKPDVNLQMFAQEINSNTKYVSKYINHKYGVSFSAFVNELRIKDALEFLKNPNNAHYTVESVAKMAGFNSKSAFNAVFKKITNQTPTEYRESFG